MSVSRYFVVQVWGMTQCAASFQASARAVDEMEAQAFKTVEDLCHFLVAAATTSGVGNAVPVATDSGQGEPQ